MTVLIRLLILLGIGYFLYTKIRKYLNVESSADKKKVDSEKPQNPEEPIKIDPKTGKPI